MSKNKTESKTEIEKNLMLRCGEGQLEYIEPRIIFANK